MSRPTYEWAKALGRLKDVAVAGPGMTEQQQLEQCKQLAAASGLPLGLVAALYQQGREEQLELLKVKGAPGDSCLVAPGPEPAPEPPRLAQDERKPQAAPVPARDQAKAAAADLESDDWPF